MKWTDDLRADLYVDGQLSDEAVQELVRTLHQDRGLRREVDEIRDLRMLMKQAYPVARENDVAVAERGGRRRYWAASAAAVVLAFTLGLLLPGGEEAASPATVLAQAEGTVPVILHVPDKSPENWARALDIAEAFGARQVKVEILANSSGLDLLSAARSPYARRIRALAAKYPGLAFVACASGLEKLREQGIDAGLVPGVATAPSAVEHVAEKVSRGWHYIKL